MRSPIPACVLAAPVLLSSVALFQDGADQAEKKKPYKVGHLVHEPIILPDLAGETHDLFEVHEEKILVLCFWSMRDPIARKYEGRLKKLHADYAAQGVVLLLVDSNFDEIFSPLKDPLEKIRKYQEERKLSFTILIDRGNKIADDFKALTANHVFVIDPKRFLRYAGGIDNDPEETLVQGRREWLREALDAVVAGQLPKDAITRPRGRKIKREPTGAAKDR